MFSMRSNVFDKLLERATSKTLLEPEWDAIMQICDNIRQGDVQPYYAVGAIKKKLDNENPHVCKYALYVLESVVKNCGTIVHREVATTDFMTFLHELAKKRQDPVKSKILELIQVWSHAFRSNPNYKIVQSTFLLMKAEGFSFPTLSESDAMFAVEKAPEWMDGELCYNCRVQFSTFLRKHHCRACGQVFCQKCSSKNSIIPKFGIEKEVRVCDACFEQLSKPSTFEKKDELPADYVNSILSKQPQGPPSKSEAEIREEEELQLALALSQSEAEAKEKQKIKPAKQNVSSSFPPPSSSESIYSQPQKQKKQSQTQQSLLDTSGMEPELARYLNRNYWEQKSLEIKKSTNQPSAPSVGTLNSTSSLKENLTNSTEKEKEEEKEIKENDEEREQFLKALNSSIEIFVNRMKSNSQRNRSISTDSSVQSLFLTLTAMHPTLIKYIKQQEDARAYYESLQDKLSQLKDARDALDVLREEYREKEKKKQEEMERLRQIQLAEKLEVLRQQKQVYLEYQRQMALKRMEEQEMEMRGRLQIQKQNQSLKNNYYPYGQPSFQYGTPGAPPTFPYPANQIYSNSSSTVPGQPITTLPQLNHQPESNPSLSQIQPSQPPPPSHFSYHSLGAPPNSLPPNLQSQIYHHYPPPPPQQQQQQQQQLPTTTQQPPLGYLNPQQSFPQYSNFQPQPDSHQQQQQINNFNNFNQQQQNLLPLQQQQLPQQQMTNQQLQQPQQAQTATELINFD